MAKRPPPANVQHRHVFAGHKAPDKQELPLRFVPSHRVVVDEGVINVVSVPGRIHECGCNWWSKPIPLRDHELRVPLVRTK